MSTSKRTTSGRPRLLWLGLVAGAALVAGVVAVIAGQVPPPDEPMRRGQVLPSTAQKAESNQRRIEGLVTMDGNPVGGASVQLEDLRTQQVRSFKSIADGTYSFTGLSKDVSYKIIARTGNAESSAKIVSSFDSRGTVTVNLELKEKK